MEIEEEEDDKDELNLIVNYNKAWMFIAVYNTIAVVETLSGH